MEPLVVFYIEDPILSLTFNDSGNVTESDYDAIQAKIGLEYFMKMTSGNVRDG